MLCRSGCIAETMVEAFAPWCFHLSVFSTLAHLGVVGAIRSLLFTRSPLFSVFTFKVWGIGDGPLVPSGASCSELGLNSSSPCHSALYHDSGSAQHVC